MRADGYYKRRVEGYDELKVALMEKVEEDWLERHLFQQKRENLHTLQEPLEQRKTPNAKPFQRKPKPKPKPSAKHQAKMEQDAKPKEPPRFTASLQCKFCGRKGHYDSPCWDKHPEKRPKNFTPRPPKPQALPSQPSRPSQPSQGMVMDRENKKRKADVLLLQGGTLIASAEINGRKVDAIIDTGANMSVIS